MACFLSLPIANKHLRSRKFQETLKGQEKLVTPIHAAFESGLSNGFELEFSNNIAAHYTFGHCIGTGSFGSVNKGRSVTSGQEVAIKAIPKQRANLAREQVLDKILKEVSILDALHGCYGIVELIDCFEDDHFAYLVTELCSAGDLQKVSDVNGIFNERCLATVAVEVLRIVKSCHDNSVLHGDVKPANFVIKHLQNPLMTREVRADSGDWLRAVDFGCGQMLHGGRFTKRKGTPVYMAPEVFRRDYGPEADVWSIGVMLYQLYSRRFPFWETTTSCKTSKLEEVIHAVTTSEITFDYGPWLQMSQDGIDFMERCLQRNYRDRMSLAEALQHRWIRSIQKQPVKKPLKSNIVPGPSVAREAHTTALSTLSNVT